MAKSPNHALAAAMAEAGMSNKGLARRVQDLARRDGNSISTDHILVRKWLEGTVPRERTAEYVTLAVSERLGRKVGLAKLGFPHNGSGRAADPVKELPAEYPSDAQRSASLLADLTKIDLDRADAPDIVPWSSEALPGLITGYLFGDGFSMPAAARSNGADPLDAAAIRMTTAHLMDLDFQLGGGHTRELLLFFFRNRVLPLFKAMPAGQERRGDLFAATAELAQLLGWSAYDAGRHGAAQRYFAYGLRLAREAGDAVLGGRLLSNLSHQANYLGKYADAVQLARAAQAAARGNAPATVESMFLAMEARALASLGLAKDCAMALNRAENVFARRNPCEDPSWICYFDQAELAGESAHCFRDLGRAKETQRYAALAVEPSITPARTRAFIGLVDAAGALHAGNVDEAVQLAGNAVILAGALQSSRYRKYVTDFQASLADSTPSDLRVAEFDALVQVRLGSTVGSPVVTRCR